MELHQLANVCMPGLLFNSTTIYLKVYTHCDLWGKILKIQNRILTLSLSLSDSVAMLQKISNLLDCFEIGMVGKLL